MASFSPRCMGWCWAIGRWPVRELRWSHGLQARFVVDDPDASTSAALFVRELGRKQIEPVRNLAVAYPRNFDELHLLVFVKRGFRCSLSPRKLHGPILVSGKPASRSWGVRSGFTHLFWEAGPWRRSERGLRHHVGRRREQALPFFLLSPNSSRSIV